MTNTFHELRLAIRVLRNGPEFTLVAVCVLALGIAANTTVFSWIDTFLLRPLPGVAAADRVVSIEELPPDGGPSPCAHPDFRDFQRQMTTVSGVISTHNTFFTIGQDDRPRRAMGEIVSANYFAVLGVKPFLGRMFLPEEDRDESGAFPIAVISHRLWRNHFVSDPAIAGRVVRINGRPLTVVGVAAPDFAGTIGGAAMDVWVPMSMNVQMGALNTWAAADRNAKFMRPLARLSPGVTVEQAAAEARAVAARIAAAYPATHKGVSATVVPMWKASYGIQKSLLKPLRILMFTCWLVLLIACANVTNLLMARSVTRRREYGIRMALGASRWKLVRHMLMEVLLLTAGGAAAGLLLAQWMGESLYYLFPAVDSSIRTALEPMLNPRLSGTVFGFTVLLSAGAILLSTLLPALAMRSVKVSETLKEGGRGKTSGKASQRTRTVLLVAEVALASVALFGAGLAVRSFQKFSSLNLGFEPRTILVTRLPLSTNAYSLAQEKAFCRTLRLRLMASPAVAGAVNADSVPLSMFPPSDERVQLEGSERHQEGVIEIPRAIVTPGYFRLMGIPLVAGRDFTDQDERKAPPVIIVNESFVRHYFDGKDPLGRKVRVSGVLSTVVGVAKDSKYRNPPEPPTPFFYGPFQQIFWSGHNNFLYVQSSGDLDATRAVLRREINAMDSSIALEEARTLMEYTRMSLFVEKLIASLLSALGLMALVLASAGLYSVMAYDVNERTQEIGVRMALGARPREVLALVLRNGLLVTLVGIGTGLGSTLALLRVASSSMDIPMSMEPAVFLAASGFLILVAMVASYLPARRASRVDPVTALRAE
ncbi:ABC transporter permease [uncultured Paludibaculum sp.]|uniref:ABC transporter permease n=1 Tax=uncultured Paludibaculum sp. TaxID=1765020 RepID=UPI002AAB8C90|nr:ABC transporter permease [uncultured Paludibaculum sp.]